MLQTEEIYPTESVTFPEIGEFEKETEMLFESIHYDKKKFRRVKKGEAFYVVINELAPQICPVIAISPDGLIFDYVDTGVSFTELRIMDMLHIGKGFVLDNVHFIKSSEAEILNKYTTEFTKTKRCSLEFISLSMSQRKKLDMYINEYTKEFEN